ncbi:hypothetical protein FQR65_LT08177 [Abscondita terminalis]|nr:hypothetical protein FQR65_LT08177 [Abscondita terminalis]
MKSILIAYVFLVAMKCCKADFCQYNFSVSDFKKSGAIEEVTSFIIDKGTVVSCENSTVNDSLINFYLYTNADRSGTKLDTISPSISLKKTIIQIPGWTCNISNDLMPDLKEAYLNIYDANVIIVDWSIYAAKKYGEAFCHAPYISKAIANFLAKLELNVGILVNTMHVIGHSMGGQISGLTGQYLQSVHNKKLGRITGLDPAGPLFFGEHENKRLDKSDATFVDVIHTNGYLLGYGARCGHVDFFPGCGTFQNGCPFNMSNILSVDFIVQKFACDHLRSVDYMIESVSSTNFIGRACLTCLSIICINPDTSMMGESCSPSSADKSYYLTTKNKRPFAKG